MGGPKKGCRECGETVLVGELCYDHAKLCIRCGNPYDPLHKHVCNPNTTWDAFVEWAGDNGVSLEHQEDWQPWYECWMNGMQYGIAVNEGRA